MLLMAEHTQPSAPAIREPALVTANITYFIFHPLLLIRYVVLFISLPVSDAEPTTVAVLAMLMFLCFP